MDTKEYHFLSAEVESLGSLGSLGSLSGNTPGSAQHINVLEK